MKTILAVLALGVVVLTGCGTAQVNEPTPTITVVTGLPAPSLTPTVGIVPGSTPTCTAIVPGMPDGLCAEQTMTPISTTVVLVEFSVWQDFMPGIPSGGPPLHANLSLSIDWPDKITPNIAHGTLRLVRANGDELITADLQLNQWVDDLGLVQPGPQQVNFSIPPMPVAAQLVEGELLHGTATLNLADKILTVDLPETALLFTH